MRFSAAVSTLIRCRGPDRPAVPAVPAVPAGLADAGAADVRHATATAAASSRAGRLRRIRVITHKPDPTADGGQVPAARPVHNGRMTYTGDVTVGGPADTRELPGLTITKLSVGPMDNNAYLLRDTDTGELALIDAANDYDTLRELL